MSAMFLALNGVQPQSISYMQKETEVTIRVEL